MPRYMYRFYASTAVALVATGAFADLAAEDVWEDWKTYTTSFGYEVTGEETRSGDTLTITGIVMQASDDTLGSAAQATIDQIVLQEQADGTVTIDLPGIVPFEMTAPNELGGSTRVSMDYRQTGSDIVASGTSDAIDYTYSFDTVSLQTTGFEVNGEVLPPETNAIDVTINALTGTSQMTLDSLRRYVQNLQANSVSYTLSTTEAATGSKSDISGQFQDIKFEGSGAVPLRDVDSSDMDAMLAAGFAADGKFSYAANALTLAVESPDGPVEGSVVTGASEVGVSMNQSGLSYRVGQSDLQVDMSAAQFPAPLNFGIARSELNFAVPVRQSDAVEDFAFGFALEGVSVSDMLWGMFDPNEQLPRDPATLALDLTGKARLLLDFLDPAAVAGMNPEEAPAEVESLNINTFKVSIAGADLSGDGGFTFNNTAGPIPQPVGALNLTLTGGNALIDKLIATGLLPEEQAMGMRMMMGLLAVPGSAPDTLTSTIEINEQGHVMANGQRIQ